MKIDCYEYRRSMELLNLRMRLEKGMFDTKEIEEIEERIIDIERELEIE